MTAPKRSRDSLRRDRAAAVRQRDSAMAQANRADLSDKDRAAHERNAVRLVAIINDLDRELGRTP